jgi:hypothetical protein
MLPPAIVRDGKNRWAGAKTCYTKMTGTQHRDAEAGK